MIVRIVFAFVVVAISCKQGPSKSFGDNCEPNATSTYFLCLETQDDPKAKERSVQYRLLKKDGEPIVDGVVTNGRVSWLDDNTIEIFETPGMIPTQLTKEDLIKVYSIRTKSFMTKRQYLDSL